MLRADAALQRAGVRGLTVRELDDLLRLRGCGVAYLTAATNRPRVLAQALVEGGLAIEDPNTGILYTPRARPVAPSNPPAGTQGTDAHPYSPAEAMPSTHEAEGAGCPQSSGAPVREVVGDSGALDGAARREATP